MNAIVISPQQYAELIQKLDSLKHLLTQKQKDPSNLFVDNQEFIQLMNISKRTAQKWRDEGIISFSQIGSKIYYSMADVQDLLAKTYRPAFNGNV